ncbi:MAG: GNAT family N-acetyltransferase [Vicinamibacterales bacterium]
MRQLIGTTGRGFFDPALSVVAPAPGGGLDGLAIVTRIADGTAHLAQLAVRASAQGRRLGPALLEGGPRRAARRSGHRSMTPLVHEGNRRARHSYDRAGFVTTAVPGWGGWRLDQPRTSSSEALATGEVSTRR